MAQVGELEVVIRADVRRLTWSLEDFNFRMRIAMAPHWWNRLAISLHWTLRRVARLRWTLTDR